MNALDSFQIWTYLIIKSTNYLRNWLTWPNYFDWTFHIIYSCHCQKLYSKCQNCVNWKPTITQSSVRKHRLLYPEMQWNTINRIIAHFRCRNWRNHHHRFAWVSRSPKEPINTAMFGSASQCACLVPHWIAGTHQGGLGRFNNLKWINCCSRDIDALNPIGFSVIHNISVTRLRHTLMIRLCCDSCKQSAKFSEHDQLFSKKIRWNSVKSMPIVIIHLS